ncbi:MAG: hypothetical protein JW855_05225 [Gammaproteobacteria bacterium]|nr:hypothetical protein [Gammaproteobacteria bacterium]
MNNETLFTTKVKPPVPVRVNKWVIITIALLCAFLIAIALVYAFRTPQHSSKPAALKLDDQNLAPTRVSAQIKTLPGSYAETTKIRSILDALEPKRPIIPKEVQQELALLKQQQSVLEQRLSGFNQQQQQTQASMIQDRQAKESGLFFPGAAPQMSTDLFKKEEPTKSSTEKIESTSAPQSSYEQQNMQSQKIKFLEAADTPKEIYNIHSLVKPLSPYEIQAGTIIPAVLLTGVNTSLPGTAVAQISEDVYDTVTGQYLLLPKGSKVIGEYDPKISYGQERVLMAFTRVIRPDGSSILLSKTTGTDLQGSAGVKGDVNNHWMRILGAATLSTILSVGAGVAADNQGNDNTNYRSAAQNAILGGAGAIAQTGQGLTDRAMDIQPTLTIPSGFEFNIIVQKDMILEPYSYAT